MANKKNMKKGAKNKKGFWAKLFDGLDKKMEAAANSSSCCCCSEDGAKSKKGKSGCCN
jgi:hypothetical protein